MQTDGSVAYSFDFRIDNLAGSDGNIFFSPATAPYSSGQNYIDSLGFTVNQDLAGTVLWIWEGPIVQTITTSLTAGTDYTISGTMTRAANTFTYTALLNGNLLRSGSFGDGFTDNRGINAVELYQGSGGASNNTSFDNIEVTTVPEPASLAAMGLGFIALSRRRRR